MGMSALKNAAIALFLLLGLSTSAAGACDPRKVLSVLGPQASSSAPSFGDSFFHQEKERLKAILENHTPPTLDQLGLTRPESKLAFFELLNERIPANPLRLETLLASSGNLERKSVLRILKRFKTERGLRLSSSSDTLESLYLIAHPTKTGYLKSFLPSLDDSTEIILRSRIESAVLKDNLEKALKELKLLDDPKMLEQFRLWRSEHKNLENIAISAAMNAVSLKLTGTLMHAPSLRFFKPSAELIERARLHGFESIRAELVQALGPAAAEAAYAYGSRIYLRFINAYLLMMLYQNKDLLWSGVNAAWGQVQQYFVSKEELAKLQSETFSVNTVRQEQLRSSMIGHLQFQDEITPELLLEESRAIFELGWDDLIVDYGGQKPAKPPDASVLSRYTDADLRKAAIQVADDLIKSGKAEPAQLQQLKRASSALKSKN